MIPNFTRKDRYDWNDLLTIVHDLRHEGGCSWDRAQTHASLRRCMLEEACEVCEAIDLENMPLLQEELGDVLLQVVFHADMEADAGTFTLEDVISGVSRKMVSRHPHVFPGAESDASKSWEELKKQEKGRLSRTDDMNAVARTLPALWRAEKLLKKAAGLDVPPPPEARTAEEAVGDALLSAVAGARTAGVDPEAALHAACERYIARCARAEEEAEQ